MNAVFKLMILSITMNFATGIMLYNVLDYNGQSVFDVSSTGGLTYNQEYTTEFTGTMNGSVYPSDVLETKGNAIYRILDTLNLGFIAKFISAVDKYMFGFINVLRAIFGGMLGSGSEFLFGILKGAISIGYMLGAWSLWTGKRLEDM